MAVVLGTLSIEGLEDRRLVRSRPKLKAGETDSPAACRTTVACLREGVVEAVAVGVRVIGHEGGIGPVRVEGGVELAEQVGCGHARQPNVPLQALDQCRPRQVRAPDERRVEAGVASEEPRLGMQPGRLRLIGDPHLCPKAPHQLVQGTSLGGADVRGRENAQRNAALSEPVERLLEHPEAMPADERTEKIYTIRAGHLGAQLGTEVGVLRSICQESSIRQRCHWPLERACAESTGSRQRDKLLQPVDDLVVIGVDDPE